MGRHDYGKIEMVLGCGVGIGVASHDVIDDYRPVVDVDFVAWKADDAFDDLLGSGLLWFENDDVAAFGTREYEVRLTVERHAPETDRAESIDQDAMIFHERRLHAWAVYSVGNGDGADEHDHERGYDEHLCDVA